MTTLSYLAGRDPGSLFSAIGAWWKEMLSRSGEEELTLLSREDVDRIAQDLGIPVDRVREAFRKVGPPGRPDQPPTEAQLQAHAQALATAMNVSPDKLMVVLEKSRPAPPTDRGAGPGSKS